MFRKKQVFDDPLLGPLVLSSHELWVSNPLPTVAGEVTVTMKGSSTGPTSEALARAGSALSHPTPMISAAKSFVLADPAGSEFCRGNGDLVLDGFYVSADGELRVELALSDWPDAMISVVFDGETPRQVLLDD